MTSNDSPGAATNIEVATNEPDAAAVAAMLAHHGELARSLDLLVSAIIDAVADAVPAVELETRRTGLAEFCTSDLLPHAQAEEQALYPTARANPGAKLLVDTMINEHRSLEQLVNLVRDEPVPVRLAAAAYTLQYLFGLHLLKENDVILPMLAADPVVSLAGLLDGMHELLGHGH